MIHGNFLTAEQQRDLTMLARKPKVEHWVARRANALVLLERGMSCEEEANKQTLTIPKASIDLRIDDMRHTFVSLLVSNNTRIRSSACCSVARKRTGRP